MTEALNIGELNFEVRRSSRRRTVGLTVGRSGELVVHAPESFGKEALEGWVKGKLLWVYRKLGLKRQTAPIGVTPEYISGESFSYLGHGYRLQVVKVQPEPLRFDGKRFYLRHDECPNAGRHFKQWYVRAGTEWLGSRVNMLARKAGEGPLRIGVRDLGFRWGSCGKNSSLFFNWKVLQLPVRLVDYVIAHELAHLREAHHGPEFWVSLERALPDYRERREELRTRAKNHIKFGMAAEE